MYSEITKELFNAACFDVAPYKVENKELCNIGYYRGLGVQFKVIENFLSCTTQYYVLDLNA